MKLSILIVLSLCLSVSLSAQVSVTLSAQKDNTLFEVPTGYLSNGAGSGLYVGITTSNLIRRGVIAFDLNGQVPAGARVLSATLTMRVTQINTFNPLDLDVEVHRLQNAWGEAGSNSNMVGGGGGTQALPGDATWTYRFAPQQSWLTPGGDFDSTISAVTTVGISLGNVSWSGPGMVADVQQWVDNPSQNYGWLLKGPETVINNAKRFATREHSTTSYRPSLQIVYAPYGGSQDDLQFATGVNAADDFVPIKTASAGQTLSGHLNSPLATFVGSTPIVAAQLAPSGSRPVQTPFYPELQLDFAPGILYPVVILYSGYITLPSPQVLPVGGLNLSGPIPAGLSGHSVFLQGYAMAPSLITGNSWFTTTDAHEIKIL